MFLSAWGGGEWRPATRGAQQPHEAGLLVLDAGKAERELGWRGVWGVNEAVGAAARWYRAFYDGANPDLLIARTRDDIAAYCKAAAQRQVPWATVGSRA